MTEVQRLDRGTNGVRRGCARDMQCDSRVYLPIQDVVERWPFGYFSDRDNSGEPSVLGNLTVFRHEAAPTLAIS